MSAGEIEEEIFSKRCRKRIILSEDEECETNTSGIVMINIENEKNNAYNRSDDCDELQTKPASRKIQNEFSGDMCISVTQGDTFENKANENAFIQYASKADISDAEFSVAEKKIGCFKEESDIDTVIPSAKKFGEFKNSSKGKTRKEIEERKQQRKDIQSTSQKIVRESKISLPYHIPKQRTLSEFLNRKKLSSGDRQNSLKESMRNMDYLREIDERKKSVEEFYKSDSEDEENIITNNYHEDENIITNNYYEDEDISGSNQLDANIKVKSPLTENEETCSQKGLNPDGKNTDSVKFEEVLALSKLKVDLNCSENSEASLNENTISKECNLGEGGLNMSESVKKNENVEELLPSGQDKKLQLSNESDRHKENLLHDKIDDDSEVLKLHLDIQDSEEISLGDAENNSAIIYSNSHSTPKTSEKFNARFPKLELNSDIQPKISFGTGDIEFDFDDVASPVRKKGVNDLLQRFVNHSNLKHKEAEAKNVTLGIVSKSVNEKGEENLEHSQVSVLISPNQKISEHSNEEKVPGSNLTEFKSRLRAQLLDQRREACRKRLEARQFYDAEKVIEDYEDDGLPDDEVVSDAYDSSEAESEPEENDVIIRDEKRRKNLFVESEAVQSDNDHSSDDENDQEMKSENDRDTKVESSDEEEMIVMKRKKNNRITDDELSCDENENTDRSNLDNLSDIKVENINLKDEEKALEKSDEEMTTRVNDLTGINENEKVDINISNNSKKVVSEESNSNTGVDVVSDDENSRNTFKLFLEEDSQSQDTTALNKTVPVVGNVHKFSRTITEDMFPSPAKDKHFSKKISSSEFDHSRDFSDALLPGQYCNGSDSNMSKENSFTEESLSRKDSLDTQLTLFSKYSNMQSQIGYKNDPKPVVNTQSAINFLFTPKKKSETNRKNELCDESKRSLLINDAQSNSLDKNDAVLGLCSGVFTSPKSTNEKNKIDEELVGLCSGNFFTQNDELQQSNEDDDRTSSSDRPITNYVTEEALYDTKSLKANAVTPCSDLNINKTKNIEKIESNLKSDDVIRKNDDYDIKSKKVSPENDENLNSLQTSQPIRNLEATNLLENKKSKSKSRIIAFPNDDSDNEESNVDLEEGNDSDRLSSIEYDENEEPVLNGNFFGFKDRKIGGIRQEFLEKEAELSSGEEASEDEEDNEDDDVMEKEEGDKDHFDEEELRKVVGRAHMKTLQDEDKKQVRLLQELYFEDGDLHGEGRERQFKWNKMNGDNIKESECGNLSDDEEDDDIEEESQWRRERYEREKFLKENENTKNLIETSSLNFISNSVKLVRTSSSTKEPLKHRDNNSQNSLLLSNSNFLRGSFLSRDQSVLNRLVSKDNQVVGGAKQSGNFVFQTIDKNEADEKNKGKNEENKGKSENLTKRKSSNPHNTSLPSKKIRKEKSFFNLEEDSQSLSIFGHFT